MPQTDIGIETLHRLHKLAGILAEMKPWEYTNPDTFFGVELSGRKLNAYVQVIGMEEEAKGILVYPGEETLYRLHEITRSETLDELHSISLTFETLDGIDPAAMEDYLAVSFTMDGVPRFPYFVSHYPAKAPWPLSGIEIEILEECLTQAIEFLAAGEFDSCIDMRQDLGDCVYLRKAVGKSVVKRIPPDPRKKDRYRISPKLLKQLWHLPTHTHSFQAELCMMPSRYGPEGERRSKAYLLLLVDEKDGYATHELIPAEPDLRKMELSIPDRIIAKFIETGVKPKGLSVPVNGKLNELITEMGSGKLPFPVRSVETPEPVCSILNALFESELTGSPAGTGTKTSKGTGKVFRVKVSLIHDKRTYRKIAIGSEQTLHDLHEAIFDAFDREEEHLYSFFFPGKPTTSKRKILQSRQYCPDVNDGSFASTGNSLETPVGELMLKAKQKFYYIFDWGDEWWHELTFEGEIDPPGGTLPQVILKKGDSPPQYPDYEEDF